MQTKISKVRTGGKIVAEVGIPVYESLDELMSNVSESDILSCFNHGNAIKIQGAERQKYTPKKLTKQECMAIAFENNWAIPRSVLGEEFDAIMMDFHALVATINDNAEIQAKIKEVFDERNENVED